MTKLLKTLAALLVVSSTTLTLIACTKPNNNNNVTEGTSTEQSTADKINKLIIEAEEAFSNRTITTEQTIIEIFSMIQDFFDYHDKNLKVDLNPAQKQRNLTIGENNIKIIITNIATNEKKDFVVKIAKVINSQRVDTEAIKRLFIGVNFRTDLTTKTSEQEIINQIMQKITDSQLLNNKKYVVNLENFQGLEAGRNSLKVELIVNETEQISFVWVITGVRTYEKTNAEIKQILQKKLATIDGSQLTTATKEEEVSALIKKILNDNDLNFTFKIQNKGAFRLQAGTNDIIISFKLPSTLFLENHTIKLTKVRGKSQVVNDIETIFNDVKGHNFNTNNTYQDALNHLKTLISEKNDVTLNLSDAAVALNKLARGTNNINLKIVENAISYDIVANINNVLYSDEDIVKTIKQTLENPLKLQLNTDSTFNEALDKIKTNLKQVLNDEEMKHITVWKLTSQDGKLTLGDLEANYKDETVSFDLTFKVATLSQSITLKVNDVAKSEQYTSDEALLTKVTDAFKRQITNPSYNEDTRIRTASRMIQIAINHRSFNFSKEERERINVSENHANNNDTLETIVKDQKVQLPFTVKIGKLPEKTISLNLNNIKPVRKWIEDKFSIFVSQTASSAILGKQETIDELWIAVDKQDNTKLIEFLKEKIKLDVNVREINSPFSAWSVRNMKLMYRNEKGKVYQFSLKISRNRALGNITREPIKWE